jgi:hypothetical protein
LPSAEKLSLLMLDNFTISFTTGKNMITQLKNNDATEQGRWMMFAFALVTALCLMGCGEDSVKVPKADPALAQKVFESLVLTSAPEGAVSVMEARKTAKPGDTIIVVGRVAGSRQPFSDDYATLILADDELETCEKIPGDGCKTPWDACCVPSKTIAASRLALQVSDSQGRPLSTSLKGFQGLKELDRLVVKGKIDSASTPENLILNAQGFYVKPYVMVVHEE